jgi:hypothetical protein
MPTKRLAPVFQILVQPSAAPASAPPATPNRTCRGPLAICHAESAWPVMARLMKMEKPVMATTSSKEAAMTMVDGMPV